MKIAKMTLLLCAVAALAVPGQASLINLTKEGLGIRDGNYGPSLTINDVLSITALTHISHGQSDPGTVFLDRSKGLGVQDLQSHGSSGISGGGRDQDEALILNFATAVATDSLIIGFNDYERDKDDPVLMATFSDGYKVLFDESHQNWDAAITYVADKNITVNLGTLLGGGYGGSISQLAVTELTGHLYLNYVEYSDVTGGTTPVPEPSTLLILSLGSLLFTNKKRKRSHPK